MEKTKFLLLRFSSIGDIILTTPVIRCLKLQYPTAEVHFATRSKFEGILKNNPYIDKLHLLENADSQLISQLKAEKFDFIIDLHHNLRTLRIKLSLGVKAYSFDKLNIEKWLLVNFKINRLPAIHIVDRYLATLRDFNIQNDLKGLDYFIPTDLNVSPPFKKYVTFAIGGQHFTKRMPNEKIIELCKKIELPIILLGGKEDEANGAIVTQAIGEKIWNGCGKYSLNESAWIVQNAEYLITHDTGMMHIGAALKKRIISIWGNTVPAFGMYPYLTDYQVVENNQLNCRPCSKIGYDKCPKGHFKCMNDLHFDKITV